MLDTNKIRKDFPILEREFKGKRLVYLDNAATTQKPRVVIDAISNYYERLNANIHRGVYTLAEEATEAFESTRERVAKFINAKDSAEIVFTKGTTDALNMVAYAWGEEHISEGDEIVISLLEHHSNLVPWQQLCKRKGAILRYIPINEDHTLNISDLENIITEKTRLVSITMMSNAMGTIVPVEKILQAAKRVGATTVVDGAQSVPHMKVDVQKLDCDFLAFSSHKMLGPTGVGVLYGKREVLEKMQPFFYGGDMIKDVSMTDTDWNDIPWKFEAGTDNIADVVAFKYAIDYLDEIGMDNIIDHDRVLLKHARERMSQIKGIMMVGPKDVNCCGGVLSFNLGGVHPHDIGSILNEEGVAIRAGHHCAQPLMEKLGCAGTARMSFYIYNTLEEVDEAVDALQKVKEVMKVN